MNYNFSKLEQIIYDTLTKDLLKQQNEYTKEILCFNKFHPFYNIYYEKKNDDFIFIENIDNLYEYSPEQNNNEFESIELSNNSQNNELIPITYKLYSMYHNKDYEEEEDEIIDKIEHQPNKFITCDNRTEFGLTMSNSILNKNIISINNIYTDLYEKCNYSNDKIIKRLYIQYMKLMYKDNVENLLIQSLTHKHIDDIETELNQINIKKDIVNVIYDLFDLIGYNLLNYAIELKEFDSISDSLNELYYEFDSPKIEYLKQDYSLIISYLNISFEEIDNIRNSIYFKKTHMDDWFILEYIIDTKYKDFLYEYYPIFRLIVLVHRIMRKTLQEHQYYAKSPKREYIEKSLENDPGEYINYRGDHYDIDISKYKKNKYNFQILAYKMRESK